MFYRGFDGLLLRERFLEGNDTHEIKLILAVSRNANAQRAEFYCGRKRLAGAGTGCGSRREGCGYERGGAPRCCARRMRDLEAPGQEKLLESKEGKNLSEPGLIWKSGRAVLLLHHRLYPLPSSFISADFFSSPCISDLVPRGW